MAESLDAFSELRAIRARVEGIEHRQEMLVRAHADEILDAIWKEVDADATLGEVYLLVDDKRTQADFITALKAKGIPVSQATVSRKLTKLTDEMGMIDIDQRTAAGATYRKSDLDRILHLTKRVERRLAENKKAKAKGAKKGSSAKK
jgi:DNA-binding transcriptional ArsR family regulator